MSDLKLDLFSNSRRDVWFKCEQLHYFVYKAKKRGSENKFMRLGTYIHECLEKVYQYLIDFNEGRFMKIPLHHLNGIIQPLPTEDDFLLRVQAASIVYDYVQEYMPKVDRGLQILAVEEKLIVPLKTLKGRDVEFVEYIDLVYFSEVTGELWIMDHKSGKLWNQEEADRQGQLALYLSTLRSLGRPVVGAVVNNISSATPKVKKKTYERFQRLTIRKSDIEINEIMFNLLMILDRIIDHQDDPVMNLGSHCSYCAYDPICQLKLQGRHELADRTLHAMPSKVDSQLLREQERTETMVRLKTRSDAFRVGTSEGFASEFDIVDDDDDSDSQRPTVGASSNAPVVLASDVPNRVYDHIIDIRDFDDILDD